MHITKIALGICLAAGLKAQTLTNPPNPPAAGIHRFCDVVATDGTAATQTMTCWDMDPSVTPALAAYVACGPTACAQNVRNQAGGLVPANQLPGAFTSPQSALLYDILHKVLPTWIQALAAQATKQAQAAIAAAQAGAKQ